MKHESRIRLVKIALDYFAGDRLTAEQKHDIAVKVEVLMRTRRFTTLTVHVDDLEDTIASCLEPYRI